MSDLWAIHNKLRGWTLQGLSLSEAQIVVTTLIEADKLETFVFTPKFLTWKLLAEVNEFKNHFSEKKMSLPPLPSTEISSNDLMPKLDHPAQSNSSLGYERKHNRYEKEVNVKITNGEEEFETQTINVSEGGIMLRDSLPEWAIGTFSVALELMEGKYLNIICSVPEDQLYELKRLIIAAHNTEKVNKIYRLWLDGLE